MSVSSVNNKVYRNISCRIHAVMKLFNTSIMKTEKFL